VALAVGDTRLACAQCGLATPVSRVGTEPGAALVLLERDLVGGKIAGYEIGERVGAGGMGTVYRARAADGGEVAIKVLRPGVGVDRAAVLARFAREAEALRRLDHPRVVRFLGHGQEGEIAYIVTELVKGTDLAARLAKGRMAMEEIAEVFGQVCDGVAAAHAAGIVHRDLKPANILVGEGGAVKVADFGLAQLGPDASITTLTRTDVAMGTFHYLAPEQRKDARNVDQRADVWALGVILYEMLTGELPLGSFAPASDRRADAIVRKALAPDPAARYASVAELGRAVRALVAPRRGPRVWIAAAAALVIAMGTAGAVAMSGGDDDAPASPVVAESKSESDGKRTRPSAVDAGVRAPLDAAPPIVAVSDKPRPRPDEKGAKPADVRPAEAKLPARPTTERAKPDVSKPSKQPTKPVAQPAKPAKVEKRAGKPVAEEDDDDAAGEDAPSDAPAGDAPSKPAAPVKTAGKGKGKSKEPDWPAVCWSARRCCQATKGSNCGSYLEQTAAQCTSALADLRGRAKGFKQLDACGVGSK
jgi:outer membrane biosynthesis protein TonB